MQPGKGSAGIRTESDKSWARGDRSPGPGIAERLRPAPIGVLDRQPGAAPPRGHAPRQHTPEPHRHLEPAVTPELTGPSDGLQANEAALRTANRLLRMNSAELSLVEDIADDISFSPGSVRARAERDQPEAS